MSDLHWIGGIFGTLGASIRLKGQRAIDQRNRRNYSGNVWLDGNDVVLYIVDSNRFQQQLDTDSRNIDNRTPSNPDVDPWTVGDCLVHTSCARAVGSGGVVLDDVDVVDVEGCQFAHYPFDGYS